LLDLLDLLGHNFLSIFIEREYSIKEKISIDFRQLLLKTFFI